MPVTSEVIKNQNPGSETKKDSNSDFLEEDLGGAVLRTPTASYLQRNLSDIILLTILSSLTVINFFTEAKLSSLNFFYVVILIAGYSLGKRVAVLSAFLTILITWALILSDKSPYLADHTNGVLNLYMTFWGGFLILTAWLGSALAKSFRSNDTDTKDELFISPKH